MSLSERGALSGNFVKMGIFKVCLSPGERLLKEGEERTRSFSDIEAVFLTLAARPKYPGSFKN